MNRKGSESLKRFCQTVLACAVIAAVVVFCSTAQAREWKEPPITALNEFMYACEYVNLMYYEVSCSTIAPPVIVTTRLLPNTLNGMRISGEQFIFVSAKHWLHNKPMWYITVVHETTHYVVEQAEAIVDRCESEEIARRAHHLYEGSRYDDTWRESYRCN